MRLPVVLCPLVLASLALAPVLAAPDESPSPYAETILYQPHIPRCGNEMIVAWESVPDATGYDLQVSTGGPWTNWKTNVNATSAVYLLKPGETPQFRIRALGARHVSGWERPVTPTAAGAVVEITSPEPGLHAQRDTKILLTANAPEDACGIRKIAWMLDGKEIAHAAKPPYRHVFTCPVLGRHQIVASATMTDGSTRDSAPLPFRITRNWNEGCDNPPVVVFGTDGDEPSLKPERSHVHKPVKPSGKNQTLEVWITQPGIGAPPGGIIDEIVEVVTTDGFPPDHQVLSLPLDTGVGTDAEMRRARMYQYDGKVKTWRMLEGATLDEEKMTVSVPITEQGYYCLSTLPEEPKAPDVWWLSPAEGETVSGKTRLLVACRGQGKGIHSVEFRIERLDIEKLVMVAEGTGSYLGGFGDTMPLEHINLIEMDRATSRMGMPETEEQVFDQDLPLDLSAFTPGRYRLVATASPFEAPSSSAARTINIASNVKAPTVTVDPKPRRSTDPRMGYTLTGTIKPGTLGNSYTSDGGVFLFSGGMLIGRGDLNPETGRWAANVFGMFTAGSAEITVYGFDSVMNRSEPVHLSGSAPLTVRLMVDDRAGVRAGQAVRLVAWAEGGEVKDGTRRTFEASANNGKTWKTIRALAASPDFTWKPTRAGKYRIRATVTNGREKAVQTVSVVVKG